MKMEKQNIRKHIYYLSILFALTILVLHSLLSPSKLIDHGHYWNDQKLRAHSIEDSLFKYNSMYLWGPYEYGGQDLFGHPETYFITITLFLIILFRNIYAAINWTIIFHFFLMGLGMYFLMFELSKKEKSAFISAIIFMFCSFNFYFAIYGNLALPIPLSFMPLIFLFLYRATKTKNWIVNTIFASIFFALDVHSGGFIFFMYSLLLVGLFMAFNLLGKNFSKKLTKFILISLIIFFVGMGLSAVKLLPSLEFGEKSSREDTSYDFFLGHKVEYENLFSALIVDPSNFRQGSDGDVARIRILPFVLLLFSIPLYRKKNILFFWIVLVSSVLIATGSPLAYIIFKYIPGFSKLRGIARALVLFTFASSVLAGFGYNVLESTLRNKIRAFKNGSHIIFIVIMLLILIDLGIAIQLPRTIPFNEPIPVLEKISKDKDTFRIHILRDEPLEFSQLIGSHGQSYAAPYGLEMIVGGGGIWMNDYIGYLYLAENYKSPRLWGILNVKYLLAQNKSSLDSLEFVGRFEECETCGAKLIDGPYLYKNRLYLPRALVVDNAVLVIGNKGAIEQINYALLLNPNFDPSNTVIIMEEGGISKCDLEFLERFKAIILAEGALDQNSNLGILNKYSDAGGTVFPNILENKQTLSAQEIDPLLSNLKGNYSEVRKLNISYYSPNKVILDLSGQKGFLVLSEKYYLFDGWKAKTNKEKEILRANGAISAIYLDGEHGKLTLRYMPKSFVNGAIISSVTLLAVLGYFGFSIFRKKKLK